jgi:hypothetical protein
VSGTVVSWGDGHRTGAHGPPSRLPALEDVVHIAAGRFTSAAVTRAGRLLLWYAGWQARADAHRGDDSQGLLTIGGPLQPCTLPFTPSAFADLQVLVFAS